MRSRIVSVALAAFAVYADTVITDKPDGVNTRTRVVDTNGYVVSESTTTAYVPERVHFSDAPAKAPRMGYAEDDHKYVLLTPYEWESLTNRVALLEATASRRLAEDYKTAAGREIWHGKAIIRKVNPDGLSVTWYYADGFEYTEREVRENAVKRPRPQAQKRPSGAPAPRKPLDLPPRLAAKRAAILARQQGKTPTVNATFGPGGKVIKVEDPK